MFSEENKKISPRWQRYYELSSRLDLIPMAEKMNQIFSLYIEELHTRHPDYILIVHTLNLMGFQYHEQNRIPAAFLIFLLAQQISEEIDYPEGEIRAIGGLALCYFSIGNEEEALKCIQKQKQLLLLISNKLTHASVLNNMTLMYTEMGNFEEALKNYSHIIKILKEYKPKNAIEEKKRRINLMVVLNNYADVLVQLGNLEEALKRIDEAIELVTDPNDQKLVIFYSTKASILNALDRPEQAIKFLEKAYELRKQDSTKDYILLLDLAKTYALLNQEKKAVKFLNSAHDCIKEIAQPLPEMKFSVAQIEILLLLYRQIAARRKKMSITFSLSQLDEKLDYIIGQLMKSGFKMLLLKAYFWKCYIKVLKGDINGAEYVLRKVQPLLHGKIALTPFLIRYYALIALFDAYIYSDFSNANKTLTKAYVLVRTHNLKFLTEFLEEIEKQISLAKTIASAHKKVIEKKGPEIDQQNLTIIKNYLEDIIELISAKE